MLQCLPAVERHGGGKDQHAYVADQIEDQLSGVTAEDGEDVHLLVCPAAGGIGRAHIYGIDEEITSDLLGPGHGYRHIHADGTDDDLDENDQRHRRQDEHADHFFQALV